MLARLKVGLHGFEPHPFRSLNRTRRFYLDALTPFELIPVTGKEKRPPRVDAVVSFWGEHFWQPMERDFPVLVALHGGAVLGVRQLAERIAGLDRNDTVIVNCTSDTEVIRSLVDHPPRVLQLGLPVDQGYFFPRDKMTARRNLSLEVADLLVGFCGRLIPQKNNHRFLRMLAEIKRRLPGRRVQGLIIGDFHVGYDVIPYVDEGYKAYVESLETQLGLAGDLILPGGRLPIIHLARMFSAMDLLIHPTNTIDENFGYTAIESMACGTPVVACAYGGLKDVVQSPGTGYLMDSWVTSAGIRADYESGIDAACRMLDDREMLNRLSAHAVDHVDRNYSFELLAKQLAQAIDHAVGARKEQGVRVGLSSVTEEPPRRDLLPVSDPPFARYRFRCEHYASHATPTIDQLRRVEVFAPVSIHGDGRWRVEDPCWPSIHCLGEREAALLELCQDSIDVDRLRSLAGHTDAEFTQLMNKLLDEGLVIGSFKDSARSDGVPRGFV